jgi:hypothetical protein
MERINDFENVSVPSWSWMAYKGEIVYGAIPANGLTWKEDVTFTLGKFGLQLDRWHALKAPLAQISEDCHIDRNKGTNYGILNAAGEAIGWIIYDEKYDKEDGEGNDIDIECLGCITLAQCASPSENCADVYQGMKSVWEDIHPCVE